MVAHKVGALAVTNEAGEVVGIMSERDYTAKVGSLDKPQKNITVGEICTYGRANLITVTLDNPIDKCMRKMLNSNVRHLLIREKKTEKIVGLISVKDIVKCALAKHDRVVEKLTEMVVISEAMQKDV
jgi:CBS domain-containing protein